MIRKNLCIAIICLVSFLGIQSAMAASDAIKTMAGIMMGLNHYPSDAEKKTLKGIISGDASVAERILAASIINLQHAVTATDKENLEKLIKNDSTDGPVRALAKVIINLNHKPSAADKKVLKELMN